MLKLTKDDFRDYIGPRYTNYYLAYLEHGNASLVDKANYHALKEYLTKNHNDGWLEAKFYHYGCGLIKALLIAPDRTDLVQEIEQLFEEKDHLLDENLYEAYIEQEVSFWMENGLSYDQALERALSE